MKKNEVTVGCLVALISAPISNILKGFVLAKLWFWFVVGQFHVAPLPIAVALGICTLLQLMIQVQVHKSEKEGLDAVYESVVPTIAGPLFALILGWIFHQFQ